MSVTNESVSMYQEHSGTIRVSGSTLPRSAGYCAFVHFNEGRITDFFYIGGNAGQQAMKAMGVFKRLVDRKMLEEGKPATVAFVPLRFRTMTVDAHSKEESIKDASVWRAVMVAFNTDNLLQEFFSYGASLESGSDPVPNGEQSLFVPHGGNPATPPRHHD